MSDTENQKDTPKKIAADKIEIIDQSGHVLQEASDSSAKDSAREGSVFGGQFGGPFNGPFGKQIRVIHGGPFALILIPLLLPLLLIAMVFMMIVALLFGRSAFRIFKR